MSRIFVGSETGKYQDPQDENTNSYRSIHFEHR